MRLINQVPARGARLLLAALPFALLLAVYMTASTLRLAENADDKLLPSIGQMAQAVQRMAFTEDPRSGDLLWWKDTGASLQRLGLGLGISALAGLTLGVAAGAIPLFAAPLSPLLRLLAMIPPLAILPLLFSQTLGANTWTMILRVILPQLLPRLLISLQLMLGSAWLFLIAAEAIASTDGLGYRIFLVRRYLAMDVILPYVAWITLLAWLMDFGLRRASTRLFPWFMVGAR